MKTFTFHGTSKEVLSVADVGTLNGRHLLRVKQIPIKSDLCFNDVIDVTDLETSEGLDKQIAFFREYGYTPKQLIIERTMSTYTVSLPVSCTKEKFEAHCASKADRIRHLGLLFGHSVFGMYPQVTVCMKHAPRKCHMNPHSVVGRELLARLYRFFPQYSTIELIDRDCFVA